MKYLLALILTLTTFNVYALDSCMTGSWYNPNRNGEGINIEVMPNTVLAFFYTYGLDNQRVWFNMVGADETNLTMYSNVLTSNSPFHVAEYDVGEASITVANPDLIIFEFDISVDSDDDFNWCLSPYCAGTYVYKRLTTPVPCK